MTFQCKAILFDLDGTLVDSIAAVDRAWAKWALRHNLDPSVVVPQIHGRRAIDSLRLLAPDPNIDFDIEQAWLENVEASDTEGVVPIAGAMEFVASVPLHQWSVVTSGASPVANARMKAVGLEPLHAVYGEDVEKGKPHPDPYLLAAERLGLDPSDCLVFEDTAAGVRAGQSAGMKVIAITIGANRPDLLSAEAVIADYTTLVIQRDKDELLVKFDSKE